MKPLEELLDTVTEYGGAVASAGIGTLVGGAIAGPAGAMGGALIGTAVEKTIQKIGKEIRERHLSTSENRKVGSVYSCAEIKINQLLSLGRTLRDDDFFEEDFENRSSSDEILEGTLYAAQKECEEKKIPYMGNLYANIVFDVTIDRQTANQLIKISSELTYRQLIILSVIYAYQTSDTFANMPRLEIPLNTISGVQNVSIATEIYDLYRRSLLFSNKTILDAASIIPSLLSVNGLGSTLHQLMELSDIPVDDVYNSIVKFLSSAATESSHIEINSSQLTVTPVWGS